MATFLDIVNQLAGNGGQAPGMGLLPQPTADTIPRFLPETGLGGGSPFVSGGDNLIGGVLGHVNDVWHQSAVLGQAVAKQAQAKVATASTPPAPNGGQNGSQPVAGTVPAAYQGSISQAAQKYGVDPHLLAGQIRQESVWDPQAVSPAGAQGIAQFMPGTAKDLGLADPFDPAQAIDAQGKYMGALLQQFGGDVPKALAAYNAGPGAVQQYGGVPPFPETQTYIQRVQQYAQQYRQQAAGPAAPVTIGTTPTGATAQRILADAQQWVNTPYVWGGSTRQGADCSGFISSVFQEMGLPFPGGRLDADGLRKATQPVPPGQAQPGDLVFFQNTDPNVAAGTASHVGILTETGVMLNANSATGQVQTNSLSPWWQQRVLSVGRPPQYAGQ